MKKIIEKSMAFVFVSCFMLAVVTIFLAPLVAKNPSDPFGITIGRGI